MGSLSYKIFFFSEFNKFIDYDHVLIDSHIFMYYFLMSPLDGYIIFSLFNLVIHFNLVIRCEQQERFCYIYFFLEDIQDTMLLEIVNPFIRWLKFERLF
jgi:hypothetical protein